jgi:hypothetical protein
MPLRVLQLAVLVSLVTAAIAVAGTGVAQAASDKTVSATNGSAMFKPIPSPPGVVSPYNNLDPGGGGPPFPCNAANDGAFMVWAGYFWQCKLTDNGWEWVILGTVDCGCGSAAAADRPRSVQA